MGLFREGEMMKSLEIMDLNACVRRLPKKLKKMMMKHGSTVVVAGGFARSVITNEFISDVDVFAGNRDQSKIFATELQGDNKFHTTDNAFTITNIKPKVQFIFRWFYSRPEDVLTSFDFTICQAAFWFDTDINKWKSICGDNFYRDLAAKRLVYLSPVRNEDAGGSMLRVLKFYQKGYRIPLDSLGAVISRLVSGVDEERIESHAAIQGITEEERMADILTGLLYEVDPNAFIDHRHYFPATKEDSPEEEIPTLDDVNDALSDVEIED